MVQYENAIRKILEQEPAARNSDKYLWIRLAEELFVDTERPVREAIWDMPPYDSVSRIRRKLQMEDEKLKADYQTRKTRKVLEQEYREWALTS